MRPNALAKAGRSIRSAIARPDQRLEPPLAHERLILPVLQHRTERALGARRIEARDSEELQRAHPVDGLGDARRLLDIGLAQAPQGPRDVDGELTGGAGNA